jgi:MFS family permease
LNIYATRIGASGFQIGLIGAMSAVVNLLLAIPAGRWLQMQNIGKAIFWTSVLYRIGFVAFILLPLLTNQTGQIWAIIGITFLMAIPLTPLGIGFNALFAEAVPVEYRAHVAAIRNAMLAITYMITSLVCGYVLRDLPFPLGYQIVFGIGTFGAAMSSFHLFFIRPLKTDAPALAKLANQPLPPPITLRPYARNLSTTLRLDIWNTRFRNVLLVLFVFHLTQFLAIPIFPLYNVRVLQLSDNHIGIGTALFYLTVLLGSTQLRNISHRFGNKILTGWSVSALGIYPLMMAFSTNVWHYYGLSLVGGLTFSMVSGSYANYMLEHIPAHDRPPHLAWYNIILNSAVLIGSLAGSAAGDAMGLSNALLLFAALRFLAGLTILKWG